MMHDAPSNKLFDLYRAHGGDPAEWPHPHWFRCPGCNGLGTIDLEQYDGKVSIVCAHCDWHGYRRNGEKVPA